MLDIGWAKSFKSYARSYLLIHCALVVKNWIEMYLVVVGQAPLWPQRNATKVAELEQHANQGHSPCFDVRVERISSDRKSRSPPRRPSTTNSEPFQEILWISVLPRQAFFSCRNLLGDAAHQSLPVQRIMVQKQLVKSMELLVSAVAW